MCTHEWHKRGYKIVRKFDRISNKMLSVYLLHEQCRITRNVNKVEDLGPWSPM